MVLNHSDLLQMKSLRVRKQIILVGAPLEHRLEGGGSILHLAHKLLVSFICFQYHYHYNYYLQNPSILVSFSDFSLN